MYVCVWEQDTGGDVVTGATNLFVLMSSVFALMLLLKGSAV